MTLEAASVAVSSTMARLEYETTASTAPIVISSSRSLLSDLSSPLTAADWVSTSVDTVTRRSASSIRPRPIRMRPKRPTLESWREMNSTTPTKMNSGDSQDRSKENTTAIRLVPTSAPSITASASGSAIRPWPTKEETMRAVAVLDCTSAVTPMPEMAAV